MLYEVITATSINFDEDSLIVNKTKPEESPIPPKHYDSSFEMELAYWSGNATITQEIEVTPGTKEITGYVEFMVCDDERCLPPDNYTFKIEIEEQSQTMAIEEKKTTSYNFV